MATMPPGGKPTEISREVGGAFALFGGYITGRQIELVTTERIVRGCSGNWDQASTSIEVSSRSRAPGPRSYSTIPDFPGAAEHLAAGWKSNCGAAREIPRLAASLGAGAGPLRLCGERRAARCPCSPGPKDVARSHEERAVHVVDQPKTSIRRWP
jgi:hypothetical protein